MIGASGRIPPGPAKDYNAPQDLLTWLGKNFATFGDIFKASIYESDVYAINDPQYIQHVLRKNWLNYRKGFAIKRIGFLLGNGLMVSEGKLWKTQRKLIQPAFHRSAAGIFAKYVIAANNELAEKWTLAARNGDRINVTHDISLMALKCVLLSIFGDDYEEAMRHFRLLSDETARNLQLAQSFASLRQLVVQIATHRREQNIVAKDMLGLLMEARDERGEGMSESQLVNEVITLVVAGHETTASTLNWAWYLLSQNADVEEGLRTEIDQLSGSAFPDLADFPKFTYTRQVIEEALRLYPAGWLMTRRAIEDDQLGEYFVPAGTEIYISPYFMQRHPALWENPDRFDPSRFAPDRPQNRPELAMLPFSAGPRNCIGELFARIEMQIHLMTIVKRLRLRYAGEQPPEMDAGVNLRTKRDIIMIAQTRRYSESGAAI